MRKVTLNEILSIHEALESIKGIEKNPIKFCIIRNAKLIDPILSEFLSKKDDLFNGAVKVDSNGNPCIKEELKEKQDELVSKGISTPFSFFEYESKDKEIEFINSLNELLSKEHEVEFIKESLNKPVKASKEDGTYFEMTVSDSFEDPNNNINMNALSILMEYILD